MYETSSLFAFYDSIFALKMAKWAAILKSIDIDLWLPGNLEFWEMQHVKVTSSGSRDVYIHLRVYVGCQRIYRYQIE